MKFEVNDEVIQSAVDKYIESIVEQEGLALEHQKISDEERSKLTAAIGQALIPVLEFCEHEANNAVDSQPPRQEAEREIRQFWPSEDHSSILINCSDDSVWIARRDEGWAWKELPILGGSIRETVLRIESDKAKAEAEKLAKKAKNSAKKGATP